MPNAWGYSLTPQPRECGTFGQWLLCQVMWHGPEGLKRKLEEIGFIDAECEGGTAFWRLDFWNAKMRTAIIENDRREWERKRAEAIARWGEGAG